jgi:hypothetical protein
MIDAGPGKGNGGISGRDYNRSLLDFWDFNSVAMLTEYERSTFTLGCSKLN